MKIDYGRYAFVKVSEGEECWDKALQWLRKHVCKYDILIYHRPFKFHVIEAFLPEKVAVEFYKAMEVE